MVYYRDMKQLSVEFSWVFPHCSAECNMIIYYMRSKFWLFSKGWTSCECLTRKAIQHWINEHKLKPVPVLLSEKFWVWLVQVFQSASYHELLNNSGFSQGMLYVEVYLVMKEMKVASVCVRGVAAVVLRVCVSQRSGRRGFSFPRQLQTGSGGILLCSANRGMQYCLCWYKQ